MIQTIEKHALNAWPSLQQMLYDGWILRFANGYTRRVNSVNPLYESTQEVHQKIQRCMQLYLSKNLRPVFRITPLVRPKNLDEILANLGFVLQSPTSVRTSDLASLPTKETNAFQFWPEFSPEWLEHFSRLSGKSGHQETHQAILRNIVPGKCFATLLNHNQVVACGLGVLEDDYIGLLDVITAQSERRKGFGQELVLNILHWAKINGAKKAYLQVEVGNEPALNLYAKLGFAEVYRYWYRVRE